MAEKKPYRVTDAAGPYVAGRKVKHGTVLELSAAQAEYELQRGVIAPHSTVAPLRTPEDGGAVDLVNRGKPGAGGRNRR
jgi:hypothetical protein